MKILTLWEPWATLVIIGQKRLETRSWSTQYRGLLAIHAAKYTDVDALHREPFHSVLAGRRLCEGMLLGCVQLVDCFRIEEVSTRLALHVAEAAQYEQYFGDYHAGRFAWQLRQPRALQQPVPWKGGQGLRNLSQDVAEYVDRWSR